MYYSNSLWSSVHKDINLLFLILSLSLSSVPYPELFWSQYTGLGSQTQTSKRSKVLISGVSLHQCSLSQSQESDVLSYSERKIAKKFPGFHPWTPLGRAYSTAPDSPAAQGFFFSLHSTKNWQPQKIAGYGTCLTSTRLTYPIVLGNIKLIIL